MNNRWLQILSLSAVMFMVGCQSADPVISNRSVSSFWLVDAAGVRTEQVETVPADLRVIESRYTVDGATTTVDLKFAGPVQEVAGKTVIEAYFDVETDPMIQSRVIVAAFGGYKLGDLDGKGTAAVYQRYLKDGRICWKQIDRASIDLKADRVVLTGQLQAAGAVANLVIVRHASPNVFLQQPSFRFTTDGVVATLIFRTDTVKGRPLPGIPPDDDITQ